HRILSVRFMDLPLGRDIFSFMSKFITATLKTNFYKPEKRSFSFRMDNGILDPLVFKQFVYGIFFVNGHYACGTHLRADDIARGELRLIRVSSTNHGMELDNAVLLNYALGPKAQRLKHKDICESGSKGVVVPHTIYAGYSMDALYDYTEGIMDLMLPDDRVIDHYGRPEMVFFGPDEGTAPLMDAVAFRAKQRGYQYWRTITTGKSFGIPHDTYGILKNGDLFGLIAQGNKKTELQINGDTKIVTGDMEEIYDHIGGKIEISGMTTTSVMGSFRTLISHYDSKEEDLNLMMTGGPDGDLGCNEIQCYKGKICLIIDGGSILFDPDGLDKKELMKIGFMRHSSPRVNSLGYPVEKLGKNGFQVQLKAKNITLPDGTFVEDGAIFHRNFLTDPDNRKYIEKANIQAFIPCGGFKDTINHGNVRQFASQFKELKFIVEGANVFFDDTARRYIAGSTQISQIKDTSANKGG
ncbi:MAG: NADP-specific glutamate dehydrogenase GdhA, partial [Desulfobacteraceae bacterium]|nr:NADP-specific glutamate dehydrogenase GdhA [Desulfobacteraceae bacterium]